MCTHLYIYKYIYIIYIYIYTHTYLSDMFQRVPRAKATASWLLAVAAAAVVLKWHIMSNNMKLDHKAMT